MLDSAKLCYPGQCDLLEQVSCQVLKRPQELNVTYDLDGCFSSRQLRDTPGYRKYKQFCLYFGVLTVLLGCVGILGNLLSILVLQTRSMKSCFNNLLTALNISDSLHIVCAVLEVVRTEFPAVYQICTNHTYFFPFLHYPFYRISVCCSIFLIIAVSVERYLAVCRPHHYREVRGKSKRVVMYIFPAILMAVTINATRFFEVKSFNFCEDFKQCNCGIIQHEFHIPTELRLNKNYVVYYHLWFWICVTGIIPFLVLSYQNWRIYTAMKQLRMKMRQQNLATISMNQIKRNSTTGVLSLTTSIAEDTVYMIEKNRQRRIKRQHKECSLGVILICTVGTFFVTHTPRILTSVYEAMTYNYQEKCQLKNLEYLPLWFLYSIVTINGLLVMNASSNFGLYIFLCEPFRLAFCNLFSKPAKQGNETTK